MHRQVSNKFNTIKQGQKTVQELIQELTKYAAWMVQYLDDYSFRRRLIATLRPSLQKEVLHRGITTEFSSMQDLLEKAKDIEVSSRYDIRSQLSVEATHNNAYANQNMVKSSKRMIGVVPRGTTVRATLGRHRHGPAGRLNSGDTAHLLSPQAWWRSQTNHLPTGLSLWELRRRSKVYISTNNE